MKQPTDAELAAVHKERRLIKRHLARVIAKGAAHTGVIGNVCLGEFHDWLTARTAREVEARKRAGRRRDG